MARIPIDDVISRRVDWIINNWNVSKLLQNYGKQEHCDDLLEIDICNYAYEK